MAGGGYHHGADGRVYVPRRVWLQKGARFVALGAKLECAECLVNELRRLCAVDRSNSQLVLRELQASCEMLGTLQNSLSRLLPYVPDSGDKGAKAAAAADASAVAKLSERMKGLAKSLDKTARGWARCPISSAPTPTSTSRRSSTSSTPPPSSRRGSSTSRRRARARRR